VKLFFTILLMGSVICAIYLFKYAYERRNMPGAKYFLFLLITAIIYNGGYIGEINADNFQTAIFWYDIEHIAIPIQHYVLLLLSLEFTNINKKKFRIISTIALLHPILYYVVFFVPSLHKLYVESYQFTNRGSFSVIISQNGVFFYIMILSGTLIGIISTISYIIGYLKSSNFQRKIYIIMIVATIFPWMAVYISAIKFGLGIDYYPFATIITGGLYMLGIFQFKIFQTIPIATELVFRQAKEAIILLDMDKKIVDANVVAQKIFPDLENSKKKVQLFDFVTRHPELQELEELNNKTFQFELIVYEELRYFNVLVEKIQIDKELVIGNIIQISDITTDYLEKIKMEKMVTKAIEQVEMSEISLLQAQISPHFINNSLSVIASMITRAPEEAKELITDLGDYLANCYYFDSSTYMVDLKNEIETVKTYVHIEQARFRERLHFHIGGGKIPQIKVPRLIIQPLVENAIRHGILKKIVGGNVWLRINEKDQWIYFEIKDDGVGMSEEFQKDLLKEDARRKGIGIRNINTRLLKYYGEGLTIESELDRGTIICFRIPAFKI
jgi:two-component system, LytTR family, sensor kinase